MILNNYFDTNETSSTYDYDIIGSILSVKINTKGLPPDEVGQSCLFSRRAKPRCPMCTVPNVYHFKVLCLVIHIYTTF